MTVRYLLSLFLCIASVAQLAETQTTQMARRMKEGKPGATPEELVSFNADVPYTKAILSLGELCKKVEGKLLIDRSPMQGKDKAIGINIESMYWKDAFELILRSNQLWYNDYPEYLEIISLEEIGKKEKEVEQKPKETPSQTATAIPLPPVVVDSSEYYSKINEVTISGVFFDMNRTKAAENGVSFSIFRGSDLNLGVQFLGVNRVTPKGGTVQSVAQPLFAAGVSPSKLTIGLDAAISMFEEDQLGDVISRPQITVRSGSSSTFQVGSDFSILEKDISGNTVQKFYPTGTILTVRPKVYKIGNTDFIDLRYTIEKSNFTSSSGTSVVNKTAASGSMTLLNGEEGYVGGMYNNEESVVRSGVPLLKDLPWWVFGLRYLFGYESKQVIKRELIVLIKAEILPSVENRSSRPQEVKNLLKDQQQDMEKDLERRTGKKQ